MITVIVWGEVTMVTQGEKRGIQEGIRGVISAMRETVSNVVIQAILPLGAMSICPLRSADMPRMQLRLMEQVI